jgi:cytochrome c556
MLRVVAVLAALAVGATAVWAQNAAGIAARKEAMKAFGGAAKGPGAMNKGDAPFDLPKVQASLKTIEETAVKAKDLFGDDTKMGETAALPAAFEKKADLFARFDKLGAAAKAAAGAIKDEASFKAEWPKLVSNCGGCHKEYRKPPAAKK